MHIIKGKLICLSLFAFVECSVVKNSCHGDYFTKCTILADTYWLLYRLEVESRGHFFYWRN